MGQLDGSVDQRLLHAADPVQEGEKWVCQLWMRQRPYQV
jgi:hypothetical protein